MLFLIDTKESSTKSIIIRVLALSGDLSVAEIQRKLKKEFSRSLSYQAIRQTLLELIDVGAVAKEDKVYSVNHAWLKELKALVEIMEKAVNKQEVKTIDRYTTQITLKNFAEFGYFLFFGLRQRYFDLSESDELFLQLNHLWIPFADKRKREELKEIFGKHKTYVIIKGNTVTDRFLLRWFSKYTNVKLGVKFDSPSEYIVHGDCVVQIFMSNEFNSKLDDIYKSKNILKIPFAIQDLTYNPNEIQIIITRNKKIAESIKASIKNRV